MKLILNIVAILIWANLLGYGYVHSIEKNVFDIAYTSMFIAGVTLALLHLHFQLYSILNKKG